MTVTLTPSVSLIITEPGTYPSEGYLADFGHVLISARCIHNSEFQVEASTDGGETWQEYPFLPLLPEDIKLTRQHGHSRCYVVASPLRLRLNVTKVEKELHALLKATS